MAPERQVGVSAPELSRRAALQTLFGLAALAAVGELAACGSAKPRPAGTPPVTQPSSPKAFVPVSASGAGLVAGMRTFTQNWYAVDAGTGANWTASPLSMALTFGMLRAGAAGATASALDSVFGFPPGPEGGAADLHALVSNLGAAGPSSVPGQPLPEVTIANGLFLAPHFAPLQPFVDLLRSDFGAAPQTVDFAAGNADQILNAWVAAHTANRITKMFDQVDPSAAMVLADAVYLKANWASPFNASETKPGTFTTAAGSPVTVPLMHQLYGEPIPYGTGPGWQRVTLAYLGSTLEMRIVLPADKPAQESAQDTAAALRTALAAAVGPRTGDQPAAVQLTLPKWDTGTSIDLAADLRRLGLGVLFGAPDLSGIAAGLRVGQAVHRANVSVNEVGTVAAAVTAISFPTSAFGGAAPVMVVDRPFAWAIVDQRTGAVVFAGHVVNPLAAAR